MDMSCNGNGMERWQDWKWRATEHVKAAVAYKTALFANHLSGNWKWRVKLFQYVRRQWTNSQLVGPERMSVAGFPHRTNNGVDNIHRQHKHNVKVVHPNLFVFLRHTADLPLIVYWTHNDCSKIIAYR
jgi:hypothetical protein